MHVVVDRFVPVPLVQRKHSLAIKKLGNSSIYPENGETSKHHRNPSKSLHSLQVDNFIAHCYTSSTDQTISTAQWTSTSMCEYLSSNLASRYPVFHVFRTVKWAVSLH